jgi:hypothetical protein
MTAVFWQPNPILDTPQNLTPQFRRRIRKTTSPLFCACKPENIPVSVTLLACRVRAAFPSRGFSALAEKK